MQKCNRYNFSQNWISYLWGTCLC